MTDFLGIEDLVDIAERIIPGVIVRDRGLLASASDRPRTTVFGDDAYPTFESKAASLLHSLARNHALVDGNKRLAWAATRTFCLLNDRDLIYDSVDEAEEFVVAVAAGQLEVPQIAEWILAHSTR